MTVTCKGFTATPLPGGEIRLDIESSEADPLSNTMTLTEVAEHLGKTVKTIDRLSRRKKDPLPVHRGKGRPFVLRHELNIWLAPAGSMQRLVLQESNRLDKDLLSVFAPSRVFPKGAGQTQRWVASTP